MPLDIPLPTASPADDPLQYIPLVLSAVEGFLLAKDVWEVVDYPEAYSYMQELMEYLVLLMEGNAVNIPVGTTMMWHMTVPPSRWLICDGGAAAVADYPELFALWEYEFGGSGAQFGLPDMDDYSPMGSGGNVILNDTAGEINHTLTTNEMPAHTHTILLRGSGTASGSTNRINAPAQTTLASNVVTDAQGGGSAHNNLHPVFGVRFIVYAGRP